MWQDSVKYASAVEYAANVFGLVSSVSSRKSATAAATDRCLAVRHNRDPVIYRVKLGLFALASRTGVGRVFTNR